MHSCTKLTMQSLQSKIDYSVELLRRAEPLAIKMHPEGFHLAFSGGKDSQSAVSHSEDGRREV